MHVLTPSPEPLTGLLKSHGGTVTGNPDGSLRVTGLAAATIGDLAARHHLALHELRPAATSLEDAFLDLTTTSVEYHATSTTRS